MPKTVWFKIKFNDQAKQIKPTFMSATMRMPSPLPSPPPPEDEEMPDVVVDS